MANTTFSGPVRSENGFKSISKDATSGAITEITTYGGAPVSLSDGNVTLTNATHSGGFFLFQTVAKIILIRFLLLLPDLFSSLSTLAALLMPRMQLLSLPATLTFTLAVLPS